MDDKVRLDTLLVQRGLVSGRAHAKTLIGAGGVQCDGKVLDKAAALCAPDAVIEIVGERLPYVSRGGLKLAHGLDAFSVSVQGRCAVDIGASTGGFTDCLLQRGARLVFAVDVGTDQLHPTLCADARVKNLPQQNIRHLTPDHLGAQPDLAVCDVSFLSLQHILPVARALLATNGEMIALLKPQFEVGRQFVGKKGVVRDVKAHRMAIQAVLDCARGCGFVPRGLTHSPLRGPNGNIEYLLHLHTTGDEMPIDLQPIVQTTAQLLRPSGAKRSVSS